MQRRLWLVVGLLAIVVVAGIAIWGALPGFSSARNEPPAFEVSVATWLLHQSVPAASRNATNPVGRDVADITAGRELFRQKCETCHAYDGSGRTDIGSAQYPRPPALKGMRVADLSDGEIFYHIQNGIRNTGMPAWSLPERQIWQLVAYIRTVPAEAPMTADALAAAQVAATKTGHYVGSGECKSCHQDIYDRWSKTKMANVVRDPREHPEAIIPDLTKPDPLLTFSRDDIAFVYGSGWKQRYFKKVGDDYFPLAAQWDVTHKIWRKYTVANGTDWWTKYYNVEDNNTRPTGPLCDGCHSVNYDITTKTPTEWNVGCEQCHGPGSEHVAAKSQTTIFNPARTDYVRANDTCIQCHAQYQPIRNPIEGKYYDWPVGFHVGLDLSDFVKLEEHKLGETTFTHFADGTAHKNRMQGNDFVQSRMYAHGVTCFSCHDVHGTGNPAELRAPGNEVCLACHGPNAQNGPRAPSIEAHTHHAADSTGSECAACHMPKVATTIADINVRSHNFRFVMPSETDELKIPNACNVCHKDKDTAWATKALLGWKERSPWRVAP